MKKSSIFVKMFLCFAVICIFSSIGCSNTTVLAGSDNIVTETQITDCDSSDSYVTVTLQLPENVGRGWDIAKYTITAAKGDEKKELELESGATSLKLRLKVGTWSFSANALDSYGNILYSATTTATVKLDTNKIYIGLSKRAGTLQISMKTDITIPSDTYRPQRYEIEAVRGEDFINVTKEVRAIEDGVTLTGLAMGEWTLTCKAYSVSSSNTLGAATELYYQGTATAEVKAGKIVDTEVKLDMIKPAPPSFSHKEQVKKDQQITISSQQGGKIYATAEEDADPATVAEAKLCASPGNPIYINIDKQMTVRAAVLLDGKWSETVAVSYTVADSDTCVQPQIHPDSGTVSGKNCSILCDEDGAVIYYTTDGSDPTSDPSMIYDKPFAIDRDMTVKAIAVKAGLKPSVISSKTYKYESLKCEPPTIDPKSGTFAKGQSITIIVNTTGGKTYYRVSEKEEDVASAEDSNTKVLNKDQNTIVINTADYSDGTWYISAYTTLNGREDSEMAKAQITIAPADTDGNVIYQLVDNLIVTAKEADIYTEVGTLKSGSEVWYGFTCDNGGNVYIDAEPSTITRTLYKNGQNEQAKLTQKDNIVSLPRGDNYYYLKLYSASQTDNVRVRVYTTTQTGGKTLESLVISAPSASVEAGKTLSLTATAQFSNGSEMTKITPVWTVDDEKLATVSDNVLTAIKAGTVRISAVYTYDGVTKESNTLPITITKAGPVEVTLTALSIAAAADSSSGAPKFTATAYYSDGSSKDVTAQTTWTSSNTAAATVSGGAVTLVAAGTTTVTASLDSKTSNQATLTVTASTGDGSGYEADLPAGGWTNIIFLRMDKAATEPGWTSVWNRTPADGQPGVAIESGKDTYTLNEGWTNCGGTWSGSSSSKIRLIPNSNWDSAGAWFAAYIYNNTTNQFIRFTKSTGSGELSAAVSVTPVTPTTTIPATSTTVPPLNGLYIFVKADSAPTIWAWEANNGTALSSGLGEDWNAQPKMETAAGMNDPTGWYMKDFSSLTLKGTGNILFQLNQGANTDSGMTGTFWYDGVKFYSADPTTPPKPAKPSVTISPANGRNVSLTGGTISVSFKANNDPITARSVTINGTAQLVTGDTFSKQVSDLGVSAGTTITVTASATSSAGTTTVTAALTAKNIEVDTFTWDNVNAYFVLTDRFNNGDTANDHSYGRQNGLSGDENVATFHGGDIKGLTDKIDYFDKLGVNAIWITAPYEQIHGWVGGKNGAFPHYAFHGYYTLDWSAMDQNMGTVEELRTFVNACHSKGIRVIMDVVMNHVGYNNVADMVTYKHGYTTHDATWLAKTDNKWDANDGVKWDNSYWDSSWFGPWIRSFGYNSGSEYGGSCGGLPDVKTELTSSVGLAPVHKTKWAQDSSDVKTKYYNPSVSNVDWNGWSGDFRTDKNVPPAIYQEVWLSAWVREVGIDGFRCDTAKHVEPFRWGELKRACQAALEAWRADATKSKLYEGEDTGAADWEQNFWMTGEYWGWTAISGEGEYYTTGGFDSMINFSFNGGDSWDGNYRTNYPKESSWGGYLSINNNGDSDNNGNRNNVLTYISSHDTGLTRVDDNKAVGTGLILLPGGVQIYYGDESNRPKAYTGCGDGDMCTRGDMNWDNTATVEHWGKLGKFRKYNPAVGAGTGSATKRSYSGAAGVSKIAIGVSGTEVDVSGLFSDGTTVYNWYDGTSATVSGGKVTFSGGSMTQPILVSNKKPIE